MCFREPRKEPEGGPGGPGDLKRARGDPPLALYPSLGPPCLLSGASIASLSIHHVAFWYTLRDTGFCSTSWEIHNLVGTSRALGKDRLNNASKPLPSFSLGLLSLVGFIGSLAS